MRRGRVGRAAGVGAAVLGLTAGAATASAEQRMITVTLFGGRVVTLTVDVPAGMPLDALQLPPLSTPVVSVSESAPVAPPAAQPATAPAAAPAATPARRPVRHRRRATRPVAVPVVPASRTTGAARRATRARVVVPTAADPSFSYALAGPAPVGVPNFFIDRFRIPPFLLPIYQAAGIEYGVRWELLAAINEIETDYGRNLSVSSAGAVGWMQFMPETWKRYGLDANDDGVKDPYNPVDAIFAAARYLKAAGAQTDVRRAVFAYNHAGWYVDSVLMRARLIGGMPADLVGSLTGLTEGRFPVAATSRYVDGHRATNLFARRGAAVIAVQDATVVKVGRDAHLGRYLKLRDSFGNTYTYAKLATIARTYRAQGARRRTGAALSPAVAAARPALRSTRAATHFTKERLFAHPHATAATAGAHVLRVGSRVPGGTVLGRIGGPAAHLRFMIRPAGKDAPQIDPKPILDGWKLLEATSIYRARGIRALQTQNPTIGQVLLMSKAQLVHRVLTDPAVTLDAAGRDDVAAGRIDRRVLASLEFLVASGLKPTVSCLKTGHSLLTTSGNISEHSTGDAVDIAAINGIPILGHQGEGSITDITIRRLLTLQGVMKPHQIISLMTYTGADNTLALPDHNDHIHIGYRPDVQTVLKPIQWTKLITRLGHIDNPAVPGSDG